jgi:hypothetical protein
VILFTPSRHHKVLSRVSLSSSRSRWGHIHLPRVLPLVGCRVKTPTESHPTFRKNQVQAYMHARIKFHAYSDIKVYTETVSRKKEKDYQRFTLNPGNEGSKHHLQSTGGYVRLELATSSQDFRVASSFWATLFIATVSTCRTQQVWGKNECKGFIVDWAISI